MDNEYLIIGHLTGSLTDAEEKRFSRLVFSDEEFLTEYNQLQWIWLSSEVSEFPKSDRFDTKVAWNDFEKLTEKPNIKTKIIKPVFYRALYRVAAVVLLVVSSLFVYQQYGTHGFESGIVYTNQAEKTVQGLEDGSHVYLSESSSLQIDTKFNQNDRKLRLDGKAFFVVKPDKDREFEVVTNHLTATVKGTTFLVRTDDHSTTVGVNTGIVEVHVGNQTLTLLAGDQLDFSYNNGGVVLRSDFNSNDVTAIKDQVFDYYDTPLKVILDELNRVGSAHIKAPKSIENQRFTVELSGISNDQIIKTIELVTNTNASLEGDIYILK